MKFEPTITKEERKNLQQVIEMLEENQDDLNLRFDNFIDDVIETLIEITNWKIENDD